MRICIDLDGVISTLKQPGETYADVTPMPGAKEKIQQLRDNGHYVMIFTARHMKTCDGNVAKVIARVGKITLDWLADNGIEFDEILFGKPWADVYIDDNAFRFLSWEEIKGDGTNLPISNEKMSKK